MPTACPRGRDGHSAMRNCGGVTWQAQPGNPSPRMFRAIPDARLIQSHGVQQRRRPDDGETTGRLAPRRTVATHPVGINLGKSKVTPLDQAAQDYAQSPRALWPVAGFLCRQRSARPTRPPATANRTSGIGRNSGGAPAGEHGDRRVQHAIAQPILVKVAPDLSFEALDEIPRLVGPRNLAGIVQPTRRSRGRKPPTNALKKNLCGNRRLERTSFAGAARKSFATCANSPKANCPSSASAASSPPMMRKRSRRRNAGAGLLAWFMKVLRSRDAWLPLRERSRRRD